MLERNVRGLGPAQLETSRKDKLWLLSFLLFVFVTQIGSLHYEVIDWDESTFLLMAQDLLHGHLPYTRIYDMKPPGLFMLLALPLKIFGKSLVTARLFGDFFIVLMAASTFLIARKVSKSDFASGLAVFTMISAMAIPMGLYTSSEILATVPLSWALFLLMAKRRALWAAFAVGALLCLATIIRTNLAVVVIPVGLLSLASLVYPRLGFHRFFFTGYTVGGLVPLIFLIATYWICGALDLFVLGAVTVPLQYSDEMGIFKATKQTLVNASVMVRAYPLTFGILTALAALGAFLTASKVARTVRCKLIDPLTDSLIFWTVATAVAVSILISGGGYPHYLVQMYPFAAVSASCAISHRFARPLASLAALISVLSATVATLPDASTVLRNYDVVSANLNVKNAAEAIRTDMMPGDRIWTMHEQLILFYIDQPPITPVATHPDNIIRESILRPLAEAGYSHSDELGYIISLKPRYVVSNDEGVPRYFVGEKRSRVSAFLNDNYEVWRKQDGIIIYRLHANG